jgi:hypothetical protein
MIRKHLPTVTRPVPHSVLPLLPVDFGNLRRACGGFTQAGFHKNLDESRSLICALTLQRAQILKIRTMFPRGTPACAKPLVNGSAFRFRNFIVFC